MRSLSIIVDIAMVLRGGSYTHVFDIRSEWLVGS